MKNERKNIFLDMDGVIIDWNSSALNLLGLEDDMKIKKRMKNGENLEHIIPQIYDIILNQKEKFWENLKPFEWSEDLYNYLDKKGDLYILTSSGNFQKRGAKFLQYVISGKLKTLEKYFPNANPIFACSKYVCANENSILIDDTYSKIKDFKKYGGKGFLWPHEYVVREIGFEKVLKNLEKELNF